MAQRLAAIYLTVSIDDGEWGGDVGGDGAADDGGGVVVIVVVR
jgi:hypothetical protein